MLLADYVQGTDTFPVVTEAEYHLMAHNGFRKERSFWIMRKITEEFMARQLMI